MMRILVVNTDPILCTEIENALNGALIDYDVDSYGRYMVDEADGIDAIEIMEDLGADVDIV